HSKVLYTKSKLTPEGLKHSLDLCSAYPQGIMKQMPFYCSKDFPPIIRSQGLNIFNRLLGIPNFVRMPSHPHHPQCPTYFAYNVRALSTSLVPLMMARPSGKTVNSQPSAWNLSKKRLSLTSPSGSRWWAMSSKLRRVAVR